VVQARTLTNPVNEASNPEDVAETRPGRLVEATISFRFHVEVHVACRRGRAVTRFTHSQCLSGVPARVGDCDCCDLGGSSCRTRHSHARGRTGTVRRYLVLPRRILWPTGLVFLCSF
jgi:hypothetical protein